MPPFCVSCRACEKSITEAPMSLCCVCCRACEKSITEAPMSLCCVSCCACEKSITEAPICHHVLLLIDGSAEYMCCIMHCLIHVQTTSWLSR